MSSQYSAVCDVRECQCLGAIWWDVNSDLSERSPRSERASERLCLFSFFNLFAGSIDMGIHRYGRARYGYDANEPTMLHGGFNTIKVA